MKKILAIICAFALLLSFSVTAFAAGSDDGKIQIATKDGKKFFGTEVSEGFVKYVAANGEETFWYDLTADKNMDICDLVAMANRSVDVDQNGNFDSADGEAIRLLLIAKN